MPIQTKQYAQGDIFLSPLSESHGVACMLGRCRLQQRLKDVGAEIKRNGFPCLFTPLFFVEATYY